MAALDAAMRKEVETAFLASVAAYRNGDGFRVCGESVVIAGREPR